MALAATHLRIAYDLAPLTNAKDLRSYYAGTLYPDSRNATGIPRDLTHNDKHLQCLADRQFAGFHTGWAIHLLYDRISGEMQKALMPPGLVLSQERNYAWAYFTAIKIVEDIYSAHELDAEVCVLSRVVIEHAPNGESLIDLQKYFDDVEALYKNGTPSLDAYETLFRGYRLPTQILSDMMRITQELMNDGTTLKRIERIYGATFRKILPIINNAI